MVMCRVARRLGLIRRRHRALAFLGVGATAATRLLLLCFRNRRFRSIRHDRSPSAFFDVAEFTAGQ
jgi:hypothetical protein